MLITIPISIGILCIPASKPVPIPVPIHIDIRSNERADSAANSALECGMCYHAKVDAPYNDFKHCISQYILSTCQDDWNGQAVNNLRFVKPVLGD